MENGPFSFTLSVVTPSLGKSAIAMKKHIAASRKEKGSLWVRRSSCDVSYDDDWGLLGSGSRHKPKQ
jgi:hypothetical protein